MKLSRVKVLFGLGLAASAFFLVRSQSNDDVRESAALSLVKVVDGDTIDVKDSTGVVQRVRLVGLDTAEPGECGFREASGALAQLIGANKINLVTAGTDDKDRYGRLLRYVDVEGRDLGLELIKDGYGIAAYDSRTKYPKHTREDSYISADESSPNFC
jgi:endonuclease YncB( thermonuclease family)